MHYCIVRVVSVLIVTLKIYAMPQKFCGNNLSNFMSQYCLIYNSPGHRVRRQIVEECCRNTCSAEYLLLNYCKEYNREALKRDLQLNIEIVAKRDNKKIQQVNPIDYVHQTHSYPQVRENNSRIINSRNDHIQNSDTSQQGLSSYASHDRKRRKTKLCSNRIKNTRRKNPWDTLDFMKKTAPEPKLGQIEDSPEPFYVFKHYNR